MAELRPSYQHNYTLLDRPQLAQSGFRPEYPWLLASRFCDGVCRPYAAHHSPFQCCGIVASGEVAR